MYFELKTGRTHQIRVHCKFLNTQIVGDQTYGGLKNPFGIQSQMLHAFRLTLVHPRTKEKMIFEAQPPNEFLSVINKLKLKIGGNKDEVFS